jgi:hypothetical protein
MIRRQTKAASAVEPIMVSKCANPACKTTFRYLHEGRIFTDHYHHRDSGSTSVERYWLCSTCCGNLTLVIEAGEVRLRTLASIPEAGMKRSAVTTITGRSRSVA